MKCLIAEDNLIARNILSNFLGSYFECDVAVNGEEAVLAFKQALEVKQPYDLIGMDIMMPNVDGQEALSKIRAIEKNLGTEISKQVKIIMLSSLNDPKTVMDSYYKGITTYIVKPVTKDNLFQILRNFKIIKD